MTTSFVTIPVYRSDSDAGDSDTDEEPSKHASLLLGEQSEGDLKTAEPERVELILSGMPADLRPYTS